MSIRVITLALISIGVVFAAGCEKKGQAEKAGENIDHAYSEAMEKTKEAGDKIEGAGERIEEALEETEKALEDR